MDITVVIPTYNRFKILRRCLECLVEQTFPRDRFEVIVVDDGSDDDTVGVARSFENQLDLKYLRQDNKGQGIARNQALAWAEGDVVVFIGDDILVEADFLQRHWDVHQENPEENVGVLGFIDWHRELDITPFMLWLTNGSSILGRFGGHQFAFEKLKGKKWADYNFFYTSNISLKKTLLDKYHFDSSFKFYGWEDIELGYRLTKEEDFKLRYEPRAVGYHLHQMDESSLKDRMRMVGKSAYAFDRKHPEVKKVPGGKKQLAFVCLGNWFSIGILWLGARLNHKLKALYFYALSKRYFMQGLREGRR